jgi:hypothetical protein
MTIVICEECDYQGKGRTDKERLEDAQKHENTAHGNRFGDNYPDPDALFEMARDKELEEKEEPADAEFERRREKIYEQEMRKPVIASPDV